MVAELSAARRSVYFVIALVTGQMAINVILGVAAIQALLPYDHARSRRWTVLNVARNVLTGAEPTTRGVREIVN